MLEYTVRYVSVKLVLREVAGLLIQSILQQDSGMLYFVMSLKNKRIIITII